MGVLTGFVTYVENVFLPYGATGLFGYALIEASISPFPVEALLLPLMIASPENALWFAFVATLGSVLGGIIGYYIGYLGKITVLEKFFSRDKIAKIHNLYNKYESWAVFIAGFTPIPFKLVTISGGAFYINFKKFVMFSILSRGLRFFLEAVFVIYYGKEVLEFLDRNFGILTMAVVVVLVIGYYIYKKIK
jgi:membrane protein YqaA with SNARE-associated domain